MLGSFFGKRNTEEPTPPKARGPISTIVVKQSSHASTTQTHIVCDAVEFVNAMTQQGQYLRNELPIQALQIYHTDYYLAQVANGGHGQFVGNSGWASHTIQDITAGLAAMQAEPYTSIFADLRRLIESDPKRAAKIADGSGFGDIDPAIDALDNRFFKHDVYETFSPIIARWLRSLPILEVVPDAEYAKRLHALCDANPQREARLAARKVQAIDATLTDPLWVAGRLLCAKANCLPLTGIGAGDPSAIAPDGETVLGWQIGTGQGRKLLQLGSTTTFLSDTYLADGTKLTDALMADINQKMMAGQMQDLANFATKTQRALASLPSADVASAIEAAQKIPVALIARLLLQKTASGEQLTHVFAGLRDSFDNWVWFVETPKRVAYLNQRKNGFYLSDPKSGTLVATATASEIQSALANQPSGRA